MNGTGNSLQSKPQQAVLSDSERKDIAEYREQTFTIAFEHVLEKTSEGLTLTDILNEYHTPINPAQFRSWIYRDSDRKRAWMVAKAIWAEAMEDELVRIADGRNPDGTPSMTDVQRSQLMINTRKYLMQVHHRRKYGETKFVEQNTTSHSTVDVSSMSREELRAMVLGSFGIGSDDRDGTGVFGVEQVEL